MFMPQEPTAIEQAVSRAIRDNLESIQRTTDELNQAVNDVVAACASSKPTNALPPMLRAQFPDRFIVPVSRQAAGLVMHFSDPGNKQVVIESGGRYTGVSG